MKFPIDIRCLGCNERARYAFDIESSRTDYILLFRRTHSRPGCEVTENLADPYQAYQAKVAAKKERDRKKIEQRGRGRL